MHRILAMGGFCPNQMALSPGTHGFTQCEDTSGTRGVLFKPKPCQHSGSLARFTSATNQQQEQQQHGHYGDHRVALCAQSTVPARLERSALEGVSTFLVGPRCGDHERQICQSCRNGPVGWADTIGGTFIIVIIISSDTTNSRVWTLAPTQRF